MSCTRTQILAQARSWLGRKEGDGSHKAIIDVYNSHTPRARGYKLKYTDAWCSGFVSACAIACGATDIIPTEVGVGKHIELFKKLGIWVEADDYVPQPGDIIVYYWSDTGKGELTHGASHIGYIDASDGVNITAIEGNYSNSVKRRYLKVDGRYIRGYAVPHYDPEEGAAPEPETPGKTVLPITGKWDAATTTRLQELFGTTVDGEVSNQHKVYRRNNPGLTTGWEWEVKPNGKGSKLIKAMQAWAGMAEGDCDGEIGPRTIRAFQKKLGTPVDGYVSSTSSMVKALQAWCNEQQGSVTYE